MPKRLLGVLVMVLVTLVVPGPALAVEAEEDGEEPAVEHEELPKYEEIGTGSEISQEFRPEPYEQPSLFAPILYPLAVVAGIALLVIFTLYLLWQPRFSQEREAKKQKR